MNQRRHLRGVAIAAAFATTLLAAGAARAVDAASAAAGANAGFPVSRSFKVTGAVQTPKTYKIDDLKNEPATSETVYFGSASGATQASYKGVLLWTLLGEVGIKTDPAIKNDLLRRTIRLTAADGYQVVISAGEIAPTFGGELALIAYAADGKPLGSNGGFARLVMPGDKLGGRAIQSITSIEVE